MLTVAYLANQFPSPVEPYVGQEIQELRGRGVRVIPGSVRRPCDSTSTAEEEALCLEPIHLLVLLKALWLIVRHWCRVSEFIGRALWEGDEPLVRRGKALLHTWLGGCYAVMLKGRSVEHIHVHHGYFGSWIAMVAASLLDINFSITLHGSDLLVHKAYLDKKLAKCKFCVTISQYNKCHILKNHPAVDGDRVVVSRLGVKARDEPSVCLSISAGEVKRSFVLLATGRLHAVKNHAFLIAACAQLRDRGLEFECAIAGDGPEREHLERLIRENNLQNRVRLLGYVDHSEMDRLYRNADLFVLTSVSEGIPLVLMEAMACKTIVLAPSITGIPELVLAGKTGFLYHPGDLEELVERICFVQILIRAEKTSRTGRLQWIRHAARVQVQRNFDRRQNRTRFGDMFLGAIQSTDRSYFDENPVLQQI